MTTATWTRRINGASNRWFTARTDRPHYMDVYRRMVDDALRDARQIVHLGAGAMSLERLCSVPLDGKTVWAVDPDASALARNPNPNRIEAYGESIPLPDACADAVICEHVVEHLERPLKVLREAHRLLRPGGVMVFTTPNLWSYVGLATRYTPHWFHEYWIGVLRGMRSARDEQPYPTYHRMNTPARVRTLADRAGFEVAEQWLGVDYPTYTYPLPLVHQLAVAWHLLLDKLDSLAGLRITITATLRKR